MPTNEEAVAADAVPLAATWLDEAAGPGEPDDPEDPQPASGAARTATTTSILRRACLIGSFRPTNTPPFPPPALFAAIVAVPVAVRVGFTGPNDDRGQFGANSTGNRPRS